MAKSSSTSDLSVRSGAMVTGLAYGWLRLTRTSGSPPRPEDRENATFALDPPHLPRPILMLHDESDVPTPSDHGVSAQKHVSVASSRVT